MTEVMDTSKLVKTEQVDTRLLDKVDGNVSRISDLSARVAVVESKLELHNKKIEDVDSRQWGLKATVIGVLWTVVCIFVTNWYHQAICAYSSCKIRDTKRI